MKENKNPGFYPGTLIQRRGSGLNAIGDVKALLPLQNKYIT